MLKVNSESILPPPSNKTIAEFEKYYRVKLPENYVNFLKEINGAIPETREFKHDKYEYIVERFLSLLDNETLESIGEIGWCEIRVTMRDMTDRLVDDENMLGVVLVPIAALFAGDYVCLDYRKHTDNPNVCIWHHEFSTYCSPSTSEIAVDFGSFLELLY